MKKTYIDFSFRKVYLCSIQWYHMVPCLGLFFVKKLLRFFFFFCNLNSISPLNKIPNLNKRKNQQKQKRKVPAGWPTFFKTSDGINTSSLRSQFILLWKTTVNNEQEIDTFSFQLSLHRSVYVMPKCYYVPWPDSYVVTSILTTHRNERKLLNTFYPFADRLLIILQRLVDFASANMQSEIYTMNFYEDSLCILSFYRNKSTWNVFIYSSTRIQTMHRYKERHRDREGGRNIERGNRVRWVAERV